MYKIIQKETHYIIAVSLDKTKNGGAYLYR